MIRNDGINGKRKIKCTLPIINSISISKPPEIKHIKLPVIRYLNSTSAPNTANRLTVPIYKKYGNKETSMSVSPLYSVCPLRPKITPTNPPAKLSPILEFLLFTISFYDFYWIAYQYY